MGSGGVAQSSNGELGMYRRVECLGQYYRRQWSQEAQCRRCKAMGEDKNDASQARNEESQARASDLGSSCMLAANAE